MRLRAGRSSSASSRAAGFALRVAARFAGRAPPAGSPAALRAFASATEDRLLRLGVPRARRGLDARLEGGHEIDQVRRFLGRGHADRLPALDLRLDDLHERFAVLVAIGLWIELTGHGLDELGGHLLLRRLDLLLFGGQVELSKGADLIGPVQGGEQHRVLERIQRRERLAIADDDLTDRREALVGEDLLEQREGLPADLVRLEVVRLLDELGVRLGLV